MVLLGPYTEREHNSLLAAIGNFVRMNQVFEFSKVSYSEREDFFRRISLIGLEIPLVCRSRSKCKTTVHKATRTKNKMNIILVDDEKEARGDESPVRKGFRGGGY